MTEIPDYMRRAAEREFPCICLDDFKARGRVDPMCRHDDMMNALEAAWDAAHAPTCCRRCQEDWERRVLDDGAPYSLVMMRTMITCSNCGSKRCDKAGNHQNECTAQ